MKYLFLAYGDEQAWETMSAREREAFEQACEASAVALGQGGYLMEVQTLQNSRSATTVRVQNGSLSLSDGPVAELKEQLMTVFFINARDLNEAIRVAAQLPQARRGPIEVRPILVLGAP